MYEMSFAYEISTSWCDLMMRYTPHSANIKISATKYQTIVRIYKLIC